MQICAVLDFVGLCGTEYNNIIFRCSLNATKKSQLLEMIKETNKQTNKQTDKGPSVMCFVNPEKGL